MILFIKKKTIKPCTFGKKRIAPLLNHELTVIKLVYLQTL